MFSLIMVNENMLPLFRNYLREHFQYLQKSDIGIQTRQN